MLFKYLRLFYINILLIIFIYFNIPLLVIFFFLIKPSYLIWKVAFEQLNFFTVQNDIDDEWLMHIDYDTDSNFYFKLLKGEYYLWFNCYFFFNFNGGEVILNELDFLDIIVYNTFDLRNLKYIYRDINYKEEYIKDDYFFLYQFNDEYIKKYNLKHNLKLLNNNTYNILNNPDNLQKLNNIKKYYYIKSSK
jgi:hypothetical protein